MRRNFSPDQVLVDRLLSDDTVALEELYDRYWYSLYSYSYCKLGTHQEAKFIVSQLFVRLWEGRHKLPAQFSLSSHLYAEVRRSVVLCLHERLNQEAEGVGAAQEPLPEFSLRELNKARRPAVPASSWEWVSRQVPPRPVQQAVPRTAWREKWQILAQLRYLKHSLQTVLHLF
ncbi:MAG TPA: hypothetical protein VG870_02000 [Chitinophagaceae bacterium]|nr:hypothetical protein [Chitinophagaceae bacterium]